MSHSIIQQVWVWIVWWYMIDWFDLPKLITLSLGRYSFPDIRSITLSSTSIISSSSDVPFSNGYFSMSTDRYYYDGRYTFRYITSSSITSDSTSSRLKNCILNKGCSWFLSCFLHTSTPLRWCTHLRRVVSLPFSHLPYRCSS